MAVDIGCKKIFHTPGRYQPIPLDRRYRHNGIQRERNPELLTHFFLCQRVCQGTDLELAEKRSMGASLLRSDCHFLPQKMRLLAEHINVEHRFHSGQMLAHSRSKAVVSVNFRCVESNCIQSAMVRDKDRPLVMKFRGDNRDLILSEHCFLPDN